MEISYIIDRMGRKRPKGRPTGTIFNWKPRPVPISSPFNTAGSINHPYRIYKHGYDYMNRGETRCP